MIPNQTAERIIEETPGIDITLSDLEARLEESGVDSSPLCNFRNSRMFPYFNDLSKQGIAAMIQTGLEKGNIEEVMEVIFYPSEPSNERLEVYKARHREMYEIRSVDIADELEANSDIVILRSGMYGGKSTLATETLKRLEERGYTNSVIIAGILGDDFTTARCYDGDDGVLEAEMVLKDTIESIKTNILSDKGDNENHVVYFDEFSFEDGNLVQEIVDFCGERNIKLIMAGLDTDYLGRELPTMTRFCQSEKTHIEYCNSFTIHQDDYENGDPIGSHTARYVRLPEGGYVLDVASFPLAVSKTEEFVLYIPVAFKHHMRGVLSGQDELLDEHPILIFIDSNETLHIQSAMQRVFLSVAGRFYSES
jgi:hypothetical protein